MIKLKDFQKLSNTEMDIMQIIWDSKIPVTSSSLLDIFAKEKDKEWKGQTISTFLSRLVKKGLLTFKKNGRTNYYYAKITLDEYKQNEAQSILNKMYMGSISNFLSALYNNKKVTHDELKDWFSKE